MPDERLLYVRPSDAPGASEAPKAHYVRSSKRRHRPNMIISLGGRGLAEQCTSQYSGRPSCWYTLHKRWPSFIYRSFIRVSDSTKIYIVAVEWRPAQVLIVTQIAAKIVSSKMHASGSEGNSPNNSSMEPRSSGAPWHVSWHWRSTGKRFVKGSKSFENSPGCKACQADEFFEFMSNRY